MNTLKPELVAITKQLADDTKELEKVERQFKLDNFKWAVLADNNTIDPIEFDLEKFLKDNPVKPTEPVVPVKPVVPVTPVAPVTPVKPVVPVTPTKPVVPTTPVKPTEPVKPVAPVTPVKPVVPVTPAKPVEPTTPVKPVEPTTNGFENVKNKVKLLPNTGTDVANTAALGLSLIALVGLAVRRKHSN